MPLELTWTWPGTAIIIAVTLVAAVVGRLLLNRAIRKVVTSAVSSSQNRAERKGDRRSLLVSTERQRQRTETLGSLLRSVTTVVIAVVATLTILQAVGIPLAPLLASAGVGGVALGIGAQSLVKDFLAGIFMIVEDQYGVGDVINTGEVSGTVEEVSLRVTRLRDPSGVIWYIRNGEIIQLGNISQGWSTATVDIPVAYDEDPQRVIDVLTAATAEAAESAAMVDVLIEAPQVVGVESVVGGTMTVRILAKTKPNEQWGVQRQLRERGLQALAAAKIRGPKVFGPDSGRSPIG